MNVVLFRIRRLPLFFDLEQYTIEQGHIDVKVAAQLSSAAERWCVNHLTCVSLFSYCEIRGQCTSTSIKKVPVSTQL